MPPDSGGAAPQTGCAAATVSGILHRATKCRIKRKVASIREAMLLENIGRSITYR